MQPVSETFRRAVRQSHVVAAAISLIFPGSSEEIAVPVQAGSVTIDRTAQSRRRASVQIPWSLRAGEDLGVDLRTLALGGYALVRRGLRYADGSTELVLLGRLRVESVSWNTLDASASLELSDRMAQVRDEPFTSPYSAGGKTAAQAAVGIVQGVFADTIAYRVTYAPTDVMSDVYYSGQRSEALSALEQAVGAETYFDADGDFVFAQKPQAGAPVVWTIDAGATGVLVDARENLDRTGVYNGVLVEGQASADAPPVSALATHDDPVSAVRWGGPFGKVAMLVSSTSVQTIEQAAATAQSMLALRLKQTRSLDLQIAPNPALEAGDTIQVLLPDGRDETHLIDAVSVDLGTEGQTITTRTLFAPTVPSTQQLRYGLEAWRELAA